MLRFILVERETHEHQPGAAAIVARRILEQEAVEMRGRRGAIAARHLELCELKKRVAGALREREFHDEALVVELCVGARRGERGTPVQRVSVDAECRDSSPR